MNKKVMQKALGLGIASLFLLTFGYLATLQQVKNSKTMGALELKLLKNFKLSKVAIFKIYTKNNLIYRIVFSTKKLMNKKRINSQIESIAEYVWLNSSKIYQPTKLVIVYTKEVKGGCFHKKVTVSKKIKKPSIFKKINFKHK